MTQGRARASVEEGGDEMPVDTQPAMPYRVDALVDSMEVAVLDPARDRGGAQPALDQLGSGDDPALLLGHPRYPNFRARASGGVDARRESSGMRAMLGRLTCPFNASS